MSKPQSRSVVVEREMPHKAEKVWRALTQGHLIEEWLMKNDFAAKVGHKFTLRTQPMGHWDGLVHCEVLSVDPPKSLSYSWVAGIKTVVTWTLTPTDKGVMVRMEQSGFGPDEDNNYKGAIAGWTRNLGALERVAGGLS